MRYYVMEVQNVGAFAKAETFEVKREKICGGATTEWLFQAGYNPAFFVV